jgi:hypothetical protein
MPHRSVASDKNPFIAITAAIIENWKKKRGSACLGQKSFHPLLSRTGTSQTEK